MDEIKGKRLTNCDGCYKHIYEGQQAYKIGNKIYCCPECFAPEYEVTLTDEIADLDYEDVNYMAD